MVAGLVTNIVDLEHDSAFVRPEVGSRLTVLDVAQWVNATEVHHAPPSYSLALYVVVLADSVQQARLFVFVSGQFFF